MIVACRECSQWRPREGDKALAALGFAICNIHSTNKAQTYSGAYLRDCAEFTRADEATVAARLSYLTKKKGPVNA